MSSVALPSHYGKRGNGSDSLDMVERGDWDAPERFLLATGIDRQPGVTFQKGLVGRSP